MPEELRRVVFGSGDAALCQASPTYLSPFNPLPFFPPNPFLSSPIPPPPPKKKSIRKKNETRLNLKVLWAGAPGFRPCSGHGLGPRKHRRSRVRRADGWNDSRASGCDSPERLINRLKIGLCEIFEGPKMHPDAWTSKWQKTSPKLGPRNLSLR